MKNPGGYNHGNAPVICVTFGNQHQGSHKACHAVFDPVEADHFHNNKPLEYGTARDTAAKSASGAVGRDPLSEKEQKCVAAQLDTYYSDEKNGPGLKSGDSLCATGNPGKVMTPPVSPPVGLG